MTSAQRIHPRSSSIAVLGASLAIGASFIAGLVVGGPILDLGPAPAVQTDDRASTDAGRSWQDQRVQQAPLHWPGVNLERPVLDESAERWQQEREAQTPVHGHDAPVNRPGPGR